MFLYPQAMVGLFSTGLFILTSSQSGGDCDCDTGGGVCVCVWVNTLKENPSPLPPSNQQSCCRQHPHAKALTLTEIILIAEAWDILYPYKRWSEAKPMWF